MEEGRDGMVAFPPRTNRELLIRSGSGIVVGLTVLLGIWAGGVVWSLVAILIALGSLWEYYGLIQARIHVSRGIGLLATFLLILFSSSGPNYDVQLSLLAISALCLSGIEVLRRQFSGNSFSLSNVGATLGGVLIVGLPWSFIVELRNQPWGFLVVLTLFLCTWTCDVMAYFIGSRWGEKPFCSEVSPKKSWEGFSGGLCGSLLCAGALAFFWEFPPMPLLVIGFLCGTAGQFGDLAESVLKREADVKDSGSFIPGHGGVLDRFDSILFNAVMIFTVFEVIWF